MKAKIRMVTNKDITWKYQIMTIILIIIFLLSNNPILIIGIIIINIEDFVKNYHLEVEY